MKQREYIIHSWPRHLFAFSYSRTLVFSAFQINETTKNPWLRSIFIIMGDPYGHDNCYKVVDEFPNASERVATSFQVEG